MQNYIMKNLLAILILLPMLFSCSSDDNDVQDYTSFVVTIDATPIFPNCVAGYMENGEYHSIGNLGDLTQNKYSQEIILLNKSITDIYIFSDYDGVIRFDDVYKVDKNKKNIIVIKNGTRGIVVTDKKDARQYPQ